MISVHDGEIDFYACPNLPKSFPLLDIHATGLTFRVGAAVTAIAAALPSQPQKGSKSRKQMSFDHLRIVAFFAKIRLQAESLDLRG
jgi:hypothetical protein